MNQSSYHASRSLYIYGLVDEPKNFGKAGLVRRFVSDKWPKLPIFRCRRFNLRLFQTVMSVAALIRYGHDLGSL